MVRTRSQSKTGDFRTCACTGINLPKLVQPVLMALLAAGPLHGYAIAQKLANEIVHVGAPPNHSGIYRLLRGMEKRGLLTSKLTESDAGPARREYALTDRGRLCLERWVASLSRYRDTIGAVLALCRK